MRRTRFVLVSCCSAMAIAAGVPVPTLATLTENASTDLRDWTAGSTQAVDRTVAHLEGAATKAGATTLQLAAAVATGEQSPRETVRSLMDDTVKPSTVALRGWLSARLGHDTYAFHDRTGVMNVRIDPSVMADRAITPGDAVELVGALEPRSSSAALNVRTVSVVR